MSSPSSTLPRPQLAGGAGFYFADDHALRVTSQNITAALSLAIAGRFLDPRDGRPNDFRHPHVPNTDRSAKSEDWQLGAGWLENLTVRVSSGAPMLGATFVTVDVVRGRGGAAIVVATLAAGYVTARTPLAWPGESAARSIDGAGNLRSITGTNPAAGAEISETVPTGARWRLRSLRATLVASAAAANREVSLIVDDGAAIYGAFPSTVNQTAGLTRAYTASPAGVRGAAATATEITIAIPDLWLPAGHRFRTVTTNLDVGDDWSAPQYSVEEQLEALS